jgi:uncharacterized repeat protein (TIGR03803 family)
MKSFRTAVLILAILMLAVATATTAATAQVYTDLYNFDGVQGWQPMGTLAQGRDGNMYGTTLGGGDNGFGVGVVFGITPSGTMRVLYNFKPHQLPLL